MAYFSFLKRPRKCVECRFCDLQNVDGKFAPCCANPPTIDEKGVSRVPMTLVEGPACRLAKRK